MIDCGPDYITQAPIVCVAKARPPWSAAFPVAPDAEVEITAQFGATQKALRPLRSGAGWEVLGREELRAKVTRAGRIRVTLRTKTTERPRARIQVQGNTVWGLRSEVADSLGYDPSLRG